MRTSKSASPERRCCGPPGSRTRSGCTIAARSATARRPCSSSPADRARQYTDTPVYVDGLGAGSDRLAVQERPDLTTFEATHRAGAQAFHDAGVDRGRIDFLEVHDCFTIAELLALEDLGFAEPGGAVDLTLSGATRASGRLPVNPDGGLKSKGHPIGASGVSQVYEVFLQLRGAAGARQVPAAEVALAHNVGGAGATAAVSIFSRG